ncbi:protein arginine N-methyltransferase 1.6-like, partial [Trifolium medium]|nr:protein arginine N-methyltransferase 1.6-like [Trifolium medium]
TFCLLPLSHFQLVESTFFWRLHDLHSNEAGASDGIRLSPPGLESVLGVKRQQYAMHCDPIGEELKLVLLIGVTTGNSVFGLFQGVLSLPPERAAIYGDEEWRLSMLKAVKSALQGRGHSLCLVADDSVYLPLLVAKLSEAPHVISSFSRLKEKGLQYLQAAARANNLPPNCIKTIEKGVKQLTMHDTNQKKV